MKAIHLIQKDPDLLPWPIEKGSNIYESGYWYLTGERAEQFNGKKIYFYRKRSERSFFGGIIESCRIKEDDPWEGRIIFKFKALKEYKGHKTEKDGWSTVMKFEY